MRPNIHILGIQGSGKGTQAALLQQKYGLTALSSGSLFRERASKQDAFGKDIATKLTSGALLSDEELVTIVEDFLDTTQIPVGLLGDGVIRTFAQYDMLQSIWKKNGFTQPLLLHLHISDDVARERIAHRIQEGKEQRPDETPEAIERRLAHFHLHTEPVIKAFKEAGNIITIDASPSIEVVFERISTAITQAFPELLLHESH